MEFLVVHYPTSRRVKVDGTFNGRTQEVIQLEGGTHGISLGPPYNFAPAEQEVVLQDTSPLCPLEVTFEKAI
jgi:hypothetical protein